jgi:predicted nuclease with TOPRIM domain
MQRPKSPNYFYLSPSTEAKEPALSSAQPIRDILLLKCKATIEELQQEIESLQRNKAFLEEKCSRNEAEVLEKEKNLKEVSYLKEKAEGSFRKKFSI